MKIEKINDTDYKVYYYRSISDKSLYDGVKELVKKVQKKLKLNGFYQVIVVNKKIGLFLELKKSNDSFYKNTLDLKIEVKDLDVYYKTTDYFIIKDSSHVSYKDGVYYCIVDDFFDGILEKVEFGDFVFNTVE